RIEIHPGEAGERPGRNGAEGHPVAKLAEHLAFACTVARARLLGEAGEDDRTAGADRVPGEGRARAEIPRAEARPRIGREIGGIDIGRACARAHAEARIGVAGGGTQAPLAEAAIEACEEAGEVAADIGGVAVAVDLAPGADALRPEREVGGLRRSGEGGALIGKADFFESA